MYWRNDEEARADGRGRAGDGVSVGCARQQWNKI